MHESTRVRQVRCNLSYYCGGSVELIRIAHEIADGVHHRTQSGESDEEFLERVSDELRSDFLQQAGKSSGAEGFAFETSFATPIAANT